MARYIDAGVLIGKLVAEKHFYPAIVAREIDDTPTADVAEVKHGEWTLTKTEFGWNGSEYPVEYTCSVCGRKEEKEKPYCHCGAKMDGGKKE